ncbi:conjugal transfer pilus assembly protein TraU (plasmid) [Edwardsiella tarda]|uniref:conjugal transfer pilus assembly protein TraU n=1 Tax=Edwardsiella tarda TaxID=636 RepID=UPI000D510605|nr:conjugal transfer pilus assembly protein TraU [Edwardsiella tarda]UCQ29568.1 conjugal transfer pilus assembly protein TraU [Edwardsiella tarda]
MKTRLLALLLMMSIGSGYSVAEDADAMCDGNFVNPISDICWECIFPMSIGNVKVFSGDAPDTQNPSLPLQICPLVPVGFRIGMAIGYWEPFALTDVTRSPYCMVNLGGFNIPVGKVGAGGAGLQDQAVPGAGGFYQVHWYKYPLTYWLNIIMSLACLQRGDMDIGYLSELDPMWDDDALALILSPEALIVANPIAQGACAADALMTIRSRPVNPLFWCAGAHGSLYPFVGTISDEFSPQQASVLLSERMAFKLHRQGMILNSVGRDREVCFEYPSPIMPKDRFRYQMVNMHPDTQTCHPFGQTTMLWEAGHASPNTKKNYGYLIWRKRNCVFL